MTADLAAKADALRALHHGNVPLVLPNAWDAASAKVFAASGFVAIATTSGGVAAVLGYPDGEVIGAEDMLRSVTHIARAVDVPVTADLEAGYGMEAEDLVDALLETGAVGMNHEDSMHEAGGALRPLREQADKIAALKEAGRRVGVDIVLNARVDVFLRAVDADPAGVLDEAVHRAIAYREAGADCVFPIFVRDEPSIDVLVREAKIPVNVLATKGVPPLDRLTDLGVKRITFGSGLMRLALKRAEEAAADLMAGRFPWG